MKGGSRGMVVDVVKWSRVAGVDNFFDEEDPLTGIGELLTEPYDDTSSLAAELNELNDERILTGLYEEQARLYRTLEAATQRRAKTAMYFFCLLVYGVFIFVLGTVEYEIAKTAFYSHIGLFLATVSAYGIAWWSIEMMRRLTEDTRRIAAIREEVAKVEKSIEKADKA